jgi:predicted esterase YcpF (UPF0227 family)
VILYLHGFNSAFDRDNGKVAALEQIDEVMGVSYDSYARFDDILAFLAGTVTGMAGLRIVGSSLGGFYAAHLGRALGLGSVIINPCFDPYAMLDAYVGKTFLNYKTGEHGTLTSDVGRSYQGRSLEGLDFARRPLVLLDAGDELLDSAAAARALADCPLRIFPGGSHRFEHLHEAIPDLRAYWAP